MIAPVDFSRIEQALATPAGYLDLALALVCVGLAGAIDRKLEGSAIARGRHLVGIVRLFFPLAALGLTLLASAAYRHYAGQPFFLAISVPLLIALVVIRMLVYGLRRLFGKQTWLSASERAIAFTIWGMVVLYFVGVLPEIRDTLAEVTIPVGKSQVALLEILKGIAVIIATLVVTLWISALIEQRLDAATQLDTNLRAVFAKFVRAVLLVVGVLIALQTIGFDLTLLSVFGGALGVGIGLGLQKLASNYIAGFTILLDRSIRLGDMITVDSRSGFVSKVTSRYVVVRSLDGVEAIVPNETLVTTTVLNHSYSTRDVRVAVQVQVTYDADVELALRLLGEIARRQPRILGEPNAPAAFVTSFGDSGINLELGVWINDPHLGQGNLKSDINREILREFAAHGIEIPFPRREVRVLGETTVR
ncbi:MAG TPA: mechanosensitive ion channel domain-containing protein, partial [Casimicrobiaceae bacterium]|nr:mechanosensitive ion channel domain-containing protein [Casimicrobiaceae bacterium]